MGITLKDMSRKYLIAPFGMMVDPIAFFINTYSSLCYAITYLYVSIPVFAHINRISNRCTEPFHLSNMNSA